MRSFAVFTPHQILFEARKMRWVGHVSCVGEKTNVYRGVVGYLKICSTFRTY
jgi:hypothetical protein